MRFFRLLLAVAAYAANGHLCADEVDFSRDIRPILSDKCFKCHGPDENAREAELRLDTRQGLFDKRNGVVSFVPGKLAQSEAIRRITSDDEDERMPPVDSDLELTADEVKLLQDWVEQGAKWQQHWSFVSVTRPALPKVSDPAWCRNGIDHFVMVRLDREGLKPAPQACKETLIRRVTLDLTGLPPTLGEVDAFLADESPQAYERVVDRLLRSKRYGEHMALMWLDAARYADTDGYQNDGPRSMWRWRDWVIDAYNDNMPFDQFTVKQLAGDLLPNATLQDKIATGFNRNHRYNSEAGLVLDEFLLENAVDRVDSTSTVWMGLTMGCARCHDHKYDPFSQKEYYRLIAYFDNVSESGRAVKFGNSEPWVVAPTEEQQEKLAELDRRVEQAAKAIEQATDEIDAAIENGFVAEHTSSTRKRESESESETKRESAGEIHPLASQARIVTRGLAQHFPLDGDDKRVEIEKGKPVFYEGVFGAAAEVDGQSQFKLGAVGGVLCQKRSSISFWLRPEDVSRGVILSRQTKNTRRPGLAVELHDGHLQFYIITRWVSGVGAVETEQKLAANQWVHVCLTNDGSQSARGMRIYLNGECAATRTLYNTNSNTGGTPNNAILRIGGGVYGPNFSGQVDELRIYNRTLWDDEIALLAIPQPVPEILALPAEKRSERQQTLLRAWLLENSQTGKLKRLGDAYFAARTARQRYWDSLPTTMVMEELNPPRTTTVRIRGVYDNHGEVVHPNVPAIFPGMPAEFPQNRLGFARWLVNGDHPLTARVAINRYWQKYFGTGLVKTSEDFGVQGEPPSHPHLLDWLAAEFVERGWDVKAMQKRIVTSATYRQSSQASSQLIRRDPENRLLARGPRMRLPAHTIRDQALFVSGLLVERIGGPSVSPYQPANLWKEMSNMTYRQSKGDDLYRRSLYTIWKRTVVPPSMAVLDAADRENCWVKPKRTNTPLQALTLLNETAFVEAARNLGQRMIVEGKEEPVRFAFRLVTSRQPKPAELELLRGAREEYLAEFRSNPEEAKKLIAIGASKPAPKIDPVGLAANTALSNVLLNLDEVISKE